MSWWICLGLILIIVINEIVHYRERRDLYNRIMSKDLADYSALKRGTGKGGNFIKEHLDKK